MDSDTRFWLSNIDWTLISIVVVALILRAFFAVYFTGAIDTEGAEYARIAQNLLSGRGYVGIAEDGGTQLFFPPLFPFAIAVISLVTGSAEVAGRMISVAMGTLLVVPTYLIAMRMYDRRIAIFAAALIACHPYLIYMSTTVFCEMTFATLFMSALYIAILATEQPKPQLLLSCGAMYGLAYLVRAEAAIYLLVAAVIIFFAALLKNRADLLFSVSRIGMVLVAFALFASPYIAWLSTQTGHFRIEGKFPLNMTTMMRIDQGEPEVYPQFGIDSAGNERGVWNQPNLVTISAHSPNLKDILTHLRVHTKSVFKNAVQNLSMSFGSPPLIVFVIIGLFAKPWGRSLAICHLHIFPILALAVFATYFIYYSSARFYVLFVPFFCIWA